MTMELELPNFCKHEHASCLAELNIDQEVPDTYDTPGTGPAATLKAVQYHYKGRSRNIINFRFNGSLLYDRASIERMARERVAEEQ